MGKEPVAFYAKAERAVYCTDSECLQFAAGDVLEPWTFLDLESAFEGNTPYCCSCGDEIRDWAQA